MVQKHKMTAAFEQLTYNAELLRNSWRDQLKSFELFASNGSVDRGLTDFINWMCGNSHSEELFAGSSLFTLLISKPKNGKLNYQQTLAINFDLGTGLYEMKYSDWDTIEKPEDSKDAILWKVKCTGIELPMRFIQFMKWNKSWS